MIDFSFSPKAEALRAEVRAFCAENLPPELRKLGFMESDHPPRRLTDEWQRRLAHKGWAAPRFPVEYGGTGWSDELHYAFEREMALQGAPRPDSAMMMIGPTILHYGTEAQKAKFVSKMVTGEQRWCQGFSEPNAGSDLASIQSRAVRDGDDYILNGSKMWTTDGHTTDWMFAIFRTDNSGRKQQGITFLLLDMKSPGVTVEPIMTFGHHHIVNQVFFDNVLVPVANRLGEEGQGWGVTKYLLTLERFGTAEVSRSLATLGRLKQHICATVPAKETTVAQIILLADVARAEAELMALEATEVRMLFGEGGSESLGAESSLLKVRGTEIQQRILELSHRILGDAAVAERPATGNETAPPLSSYIAGARFNFRKTSIYAGSNEVQKNIIAKAVLGL